MTDIASPPTYVRPGEYLYHNPHKDDPKSGDGNLFALESGDEIAQRPKVESSVPNRVKRSEKIKMDKYNRIHSSWEQKGFLPALNASQAKCRLSAVLDHSDRHNPNTGKKTNCALTHGLAALESHWKHRAEQKTIPPQTR